MRQGFTLIELMIVIAIIAIIAAIAIPNLLESRVNANENAAASSLKAAIFSGQVQFLGSSVNDADGNGRGEYGHLSQLSGWQDCYGSRKRDPAAPGVNAMLVNGTPSKGNHGVGALTYIGTEFDGIQPTYVANGLADGTTAGGAAPAGSDTARLTWQGTNNAVSGYFYGSLLATDFTSEPIAGAAVGDVSGPTALITVQTQASVISRGEKYFVCIAIPESFGDTGRRAYFLTQEGKVYSNAADIAPYDTATGENSAVTGTDAGSAFVTAAGAGTVVAQAEYYLNRAFAGDQAAPAYAVSAVNATCIGNRSNAPTGALVWGPLNK